MNRVVLYGHRVEQPGATGIGFYVRRLLTSIASSEHSGIAYSIGASPEPPTAAGPPAGLEVLRPRVPNRPHLARRLLHLSWLLTGHPTADRAFRHPDLVHILYPAIPVPTHARLVVTIHDLIPILNPEWVTRYERLRYTHSFSQAANQAEILIADSHRVARQVREVLGVDESRIRVVHLGVDGAFRQPVDRLTIEQVCEKHGVTPGRYFVILGAVSARKNISIILDALAKVHRKLAYPVLAIGPRGLGVEVIEAQIERYRLTDLVRVPGWLPEVELIPLLQGSTGLVHPSRDEGFGLTPLEAMAAGIPVAASDAGAIPEVTGDAAVLIGPEDLDGWAGAMQRLAADELFRNDLIARGKERAALFTWERTAMQTIAVHREVLSGFTTPYP